MKIFLLLAIITATITSCSTAYKTGQTPDDVYYSPARLETHDVRRDRDENTTTDNTVYTGTEDREIRRRIRHRRYRRYDDRYGYPYGYNGPVYGNPKYGIGTTQNTSEPRKTNLGAYNPNTATPDSATSTNSKFGNKNTTGTTPVRTFGTPDKTSNNGSAVGNFIRKVFTTENNNYNPGHPNNSNNTNNNSSSRTFDRSSNNNNNNNNTNSSSNTRSSSTETKSSGSSSSAPVRTFGKQ